MNRSHQGEGASNPAPQENAGRRDEAELMRALPPRSASREVKVGLFAVLGLLAFFTALFAFTDVGTFRSRYYLSTTIEDAGGMRRGDPVQMRGVNIGRVVGFQMVPEGVEVRMEISNDYPVPAGSRAMVKSNGLLGGMVVDVVPGTSEENLESGERLPGATDAGVFAQAAGLSTRADTVLMRVNALLSPANLGAVGTSATELQSLLTELNALVEAQRGEVAGITSSLRRSAAGVERATTTPELLRSLARMDSLTLRLGESSASLSRATGSLESVLARMDRGEGTLGKLSRDEALYTNLNQAAANLNQLAADIRADPKKYLSVSVF